MIDRDENVSPGIAEPILVREPLLNERVQYYLYADTPPQNIDDDLIAL